MIYRPGEIAYFHNFRMIHARTKIELNGGIRSLKGCYTPIDEFLSRLRYLSIKLRKTNQTNQTLKHLSNKSTTKTSLKHLSTKTSIKHLKH